ncbi:MAG: UrcA family protein [Hyphomonadaceae bacterium]
MTPIRLISIAALAFAAASPALAQNHESRVVTYGELDLQSDEGADTLIRRIENAARDVCNDDTSTRPISVEDQIDACRVETTQEGIRNVANNHVTGRYYGYEPEIVVDDNYDPYYPEYEPNYAPKGK